MKIGELNPKAQEAFAKCQIDLGLALFKGAMLTVFVLPITLILKSKIDGAQDSISPATLFSVFDLSTYLTLVTLWIVVILLGNMFRKQGVRIIHDIEENET